MGRIGRLLLGQGPIAWVLHRQGGHEYGHLLQTSPLAGGHQHAGELGVERQCGNIATNLSERARAVKCPELVKQGQPIGDGLL